MTAGVIRSVNINEEMREAYLDYAMSVIVARALPDARDGFKPVHRRILYAMYDMGLRADSTYKKSARIVGEVLGKYHPHGDASVYEAMARLAQDFSLRYPLVDGQGNFGSIDGDSPAAMRYTEARLSRLGAGLLDEIDQNTVDFIDNFDGSLTEPDVLPCALPNLLVNGASGIAVGMSTNIPPHHMGEVCDALTFMLQEWDRLDEIDTADLLRFIKGPDFPTGGILYRRDVQSGEDTLLSTYASGRGKFTVRARAHIEQLGRGKTRIVVSEIPYQVNKNSLIERMADLVRDGRLDGISDLRDESDRQGLRIVVEIKAGTEPTDVLNALYRLTSLEETFNVIMLALVDGEPRTLSLKQSLRVYLDHRLTVIRRRSQFELDRARERAHILAGLLIALNALDVVIRLIRDSKDSDAARTALMTQLNLSDVQATAILDMPLRRLAALERQKVEQEYAEKMARIAELEHLLADPVAMRSLVASELRETQSQFTDLRRTSIVDRAAVAVSADDLLIQAEPTWITLTGDGKLSRTPTDAPPNVKLAKNAAESPRFCLPGDASDILYLIAADGMAATVPVQQLPPTDQPTEGNPYHTLLALTEADRPIAAINLSPYQSEHFWLLVTADGEVKRIRVADLPGLSANAFQIMNVGSDKLVAAYSVVEEDEVILVTAQAQAIRFKVADVRPTGLPAGGMRGIKLDDGDSIIGGGVARADQFLWAISGAGIAKYTPVTEFPTQGRGGSGVIAFKLTNVLQPDGVFQTNQRDRLAVAMVGSPNDTLILMTAKGKRKVIAFKGALLAPRAKPGQDIATALTNGGTDRITAVTHLVPRPEPDLTQA